MNYMITMHQPNYLPWIGLFSKVALASNIVFGDTVQYSRHSVTHRNKIRTREGSAYLTIPIGRQPPDVAVKDVALPADGAWKRAHWQTICRQYARAPYFKAYAGFFEELYRRDIRLLADLNIEIIRYLLKCFEIDATGVRASELDLPSTDTVTDWIAAFLKRTGADGYLSGPSGKKYLDREKLAENGIECRFFNFEHPVYPQRYPGFEPNLSAIDLLFNTGPRAAEIVRLAGTLGDTAMVEMV